MITEAYTKNTLKSFINSEFFNELSNIPISYHRAVSQINNPRAEAEDVLLVAQFDGNKTVGYLGVLPDYYYHNSAKEKIGWLTCFWVDDEYKSEGVAANLFRRVIRAWDKSIFITNIVPWLEPIYQKTKIFHPTKYKDGVRGYLRFNFADILPPKNTIFSKTRSVLRFIDFGLNLITDKRFTFYKPNGIKELNYQYHLNFNNVPPGVIDGYNADNCIKRGKDELNWIVQYPWIIQGAEYDSYSSRYYFSSISFRFLTQVITFTDNNGVVLGAILMVIRNRNVTVPYVYCDKKIMDEVIRFIIDKMIELKVNMITVFNNNISSSLINNKKYFIYTKAIKKPYFISKNIDTLNYLNFQDGDGDCAFY